LSIWSTNPALSLHNKIAFYPLACLSS
jgi:hypothetical protein